MPGWIRSIHPNEEMILKDTKNTIEDTVEKIKENVRENKLSCILMIGFVLLFCVLSGPEIAQEAASRHVQSDEVKNPQSESVQPETESEIAQTEETAKETETESETEAESAMTPKRMRQLRARYGRQFHIPMLTPYEDTEAMLYLELPERFRLRGYTLLEIKPEKTMAGLEQELTGQLSEYEGEWSVYVKNLSTDETFVLNDQPMKSASVMKLFIMGTVYKAFECGELERTEEIMSLMNKMISYSDNASSNELLSRLGNGSYADGIEKVNAFIKKYGFSDMTMEYNGFDDSATIMDPEHFNQVTAKDCGKLLEDIYRRTWVSRGISNEIEEAAIIQDIPWTKRMFRIIIPIQKSAIISGYMLPFMTCLRELSLFLLLCTQGFILSTTLDYFDEMGLYAFSSGINLILIITILVCNTLVNKVTGASLDKGIGG